MKLNALQSAALKPKTELIVPFGAKPLVDASDAKAVSSTVYVIKTGDTMEMLSRKYAVSVEQLMKVNKKKDRLVKAGERIVIPKN